MKGFSLQKVNIEKHLKIENEKTNELWLPGSDFQAQKLTHMITKCQTFNNNQKTHK